MSRRLWPLAAVGAILLLFLLPAPEFVSAGVWNALGNASHVPLMAAIALLLFLRWGPAPDGRPARYGATALASTAVVFAIEIVQPLFGRSASAIDLVLGTLGVVTALSGVYAWRDGGAGPRLLHALFTVTLFVSIGHPVWMEWKAANWRATSFPSLGDFENEIELRLWRDRSPLRKWPTTLNLSSEHVASGQRSLAVHTGGGAWPGVIYVAGDADWSAFDRLAWEMYNPGEPFRFSVRVSDEIDHSFRASFHRTLPADTGWNRFSVPLEQIRLGPRSRELDLTRVRNLYIYAEGHRSRLFFLDRVRLGGPE